MKLANTRLTDTSMCHCRSPDLFSNRLRHIESQSERHIKETKSKCKHTAHLLTDAPNPQNKGALLFKKQHQRVKKFTLVSYGTGDSDLNTEDQIEEEEEIGSAECNVAATSDSDFEEENFVDPRKHFLSLKWKRFEAMEELPETKGKGLMMFAQRRKRMDQILSEHEELISKGLPVEPLQVENQNTNNAKLMYQDFEQPIQSCMDADLKQTQKSVHKMNYISSVPKLIVPNRTAKPFPGIQENASVPVQSPVLKRHEPRFKVPVAINTSPYVWSPTGDIIASRDERISVPAIKTGILPESRRRGTTKQSSTLVQDSDVYLQNTEEDFFSLGAEASNFMQPRAVKLKHPPPVAPKPAFNPTCPPWMRKSPTDEPCIPPKSPVSPPCQSPKGPHIQQPAQRQEMANRLAPNQSPATLQTPGSAWASSNTSPQLHLPPTTTNRSQELPRSPVSIRAHSSSYSSHHPPSATRNKTDSAPNSVASCPPPARKSYILASKGTTVSPRSQLTDRDISRADDGPTMMGKGVELFAKRQSRMEKFVVGAERVQDRKTRPPSPSSSLPHSWRYSPNVRAPPPLSYNPLLAPFYPPSAAKQPPSTSPQIKPKNKAKSKPPPKHLNTLDIMKHQPYQLDSSLFKYDANTETKSPSTESKSEATHSLKERSASYQTPYQGSDKAVQKKTKSLKSSGLEFSRSHSPSLSKQLNSAPPAKLLSPLSILGTQPSFLPMQRPRSFQQKAYKSPTPWEAASKSPIGSVDEAFLYRSLQSSVASNVKVAGQRKTLPEPPHEWKRRVSLDAFALSKDDHFVAPSFQAPSMSKTGQVFYGPPFKPAQPLKCVSKTSLGYSSRSKDFDGFSTAQRR
ncbi:synaptopodin-2-like [Thalassophryne amazonica]|uniref:synaptopodin-2-like n=1 Tax=Thalassophryne amazonica TaxID=390379 RepID=UPI001472238B|nr:synaptopodin-2-like [Thalassophryne amazonica]